MRQVDFIIFKKTHIKTRSVKTFISRVINTKKDGCGFKIRERISLFSFLAGFHYEFDKKKNPTYYS